MSSTITPNMNLVIPGVGTEAGPDYATDVNNSLTILDGHSHAAGSGVLITPAAININTDFSINNKSLTSVAALILTPQVSTPVNNSAYVSGVDLYFVDGNGNNVRMTSGGTVNATSSGISSGTATASFVGGTLVVNSAALTPADIQVASVVIGNHVSSSNYLTLQPPNAMAVSYSLTLPALPAQTNVLTLDTAGNISSTTWNTVANNRTRAVSLSSAALGEVAKSANCGNFSTSSGSFVPVTNLAVAIVTGGSPIAVSLIADRTLTSSAVLTTSGTGILTLQILNNGFSIYNTTLRADGVNQFQIPAGAVSFLDFASAGTQNYGVYISNSGGGGNVSINNVLLVAYEL